MTQVPNTPTKIDYKLLAGPYYKLFVNGNANSLPEWLAKQIKSIEITEVDAHAEDGQSLDMVIITMIDAYENITEASNNLYNSNKITGNPGNLLDLVITSNNIIRVLTQAELTARKQAYVQSLQTMPQVVSTFTNNTVISAETVNGTQQLLTLLSPLPTNINFINTNIYLGNIVPTSSNTFGIITTQLSDTQITVTNFNPPLPTNQSIQQVITIQSQQIQQVPVPQPTVSNKVPKFLFQEGNTIDIEWGYQSYNLKRKMRFVIQYVEYDAPESSSPEIKIYGVPSILSDLGKLHPTKGFNWSSPSKTGSGNTTNNDVFAGDIVKTIAQSCGYKAIVSNQVSAKNRINSSDTRPTEFTKVITPETSIYQYLQHLAKEIGFHFFVGYSFIYNKDVIFFVSDEDFSRYSSFNFVWKGSNTLLTSYKINSDFSRLHDGQTVPVGTSANPSVTHPQIQSTLTFNLYDGNPVNATQVGTQITPTVTTGTKNIFKDGVTGISLYTPVDDTNTNKLGIDNHLQKSENAIIMSGTMIGHPHIAPCVARFTNIGKRYSGRYMVTNVKHMLDNSGYKIQFNAKTNVVADSLLNSNKENGSKDKASQYDTVNLRTGEVTTALPAQIPNTPGSGTTDALNFNSSIGIPGKIQQTNGAN
jgi:hypothetical protein